MDQYGAEKVSLFVTKLFAIRRTGVGIANLLLDILNESFVHFDSTRSPSGFEKEDYILLLRIIPLLKV